jgi:hypothetical protein
LCRSTYIDTPATQALNLSLYHRIYLGFEKIEFLIPYIMITISLAGLFGKYADRE